MTTQKTINEIHDILKRDLYFDDYHSADGKHCVAGWKCVLDYEKEFGRPPKFDRGFYSTELDYFMRERHKTFFEGDYAQKEWRLSQDEIDSIVNCDSVEEVKVCLAELAERYNLYIPA